MKKALLFAAILVLFGLRLSGQNQPATNQPVYTADNQLTKPANYREWVWLSSGFGMSYAESAQGAGRANPPFDNVFVAPEAYRSFLRTGTWPDKTMFVLELRSAVSEGSINKQGRFQGNVLGIEVEVKDSTRFPGKWAFFDFRGAAASAQKLPESAACYSCHAQNGAVDNTFVQFYPTLIDIAKQKGTFRQ